MGGIRLRVTAPETPPAGSGTAVATGGMLNTAQGVSTHDGRSWYIRYDGASLADPGWELTYNHPQNTPAAAGRLMNLRMVQATQRFVAPSGSTAQDMTEQHAEDNTTAFIAQLGNYRAYGVLGMSLSMQGGNPVKPNTTDANTNLDQTNFTYDMANGSPSAFNTDGSIKATYQGRLERAIEAMDDAGMVCDLTLFYGRQNYVLNDTAVDAAIVNTCTWLKTLGRRNVIVTIANEAGVNASSYWDLPSSRAKFKTDANVAAMIDAFQAEWAGEPWRPAVSCSSENMDIGPLVGAAGDWINVHGNLTAAGSQDEEVAQLLADSGMVGPVVMTEDENSQSAGPVVSPSLNNEEASATNTFTAGGSWGGAIMSKVQRWHSDTGPAEPFWWEIGPSEDMSTGTYRQKWANFMRATCNHIESLTGGLPAA